ncbi:19848_t:CDS:2 [Dentiscutata erythropus]|uniref:19848_t:CDS:1 n=1 Tax=Dentiscutata erythropus TaxID=1348616 RepID=A0A9N9ENN0_9GLOM|nr:19848_t:CDS:2 [Dentiscutata erythropus]
MPCYIDTIVRIIQVCLTDREDLNLTIVWATGVYPLESEDRELDLVLFVLIKDDEKDPNTQAIFVKNEHYCISGKVVFEIFNNNFKLKMTVSTSTHITIMRDLGSNRCLLKVSLVSVAQDVMREFNKEDTIVNVLPNESVFFITGQLEVIDDNCIQMPLIFLTLMFLLHLKKKFQILACEGLNKTSVNKSLDCDKPIVDLTTINSNSLKCERVVDKVDGCTKYVVSSISGCCSSKHVRVNDEADNYVEYIDSDCSDNKRISKSINECAEDGSEYCGNIIFEDKNEFSCDKKMNKGKEKEVQPTVYNTRRRTKS